MIKVVYRLSYKMKILRRVVFFLAASSILAIALLHAYVNIHGKAIVTAKLRDIFKREVSVGSVKARLPLNVVVKNIEVKDLLKIEKAFAVGGALDLFRKDFTLYELKLNRLTLSLEKQPEPPAQSQEAAAAEPAAAASLPPPSFTSTAPASSAPPPAQEKRFIMLSGFRLKHLFVNDSAVDFIDKSIPDKEVRLRMDKLYLHVENFELPLRHPNVIRFDLKGRVPWQGQNEQGRVEFSGWIDLFKRDLQAKLAITGIDGIALYPYYANWVDLEKARIEKASLNFSSDIHGANNELVAQCRLELADIVRKPREDGESQDKAERIANAVLGIFRALNQGKIVLDFTIRTRMDRPEFGFANIKMAVEDKICRERRAGRLNADKVVLFPAQLLKGMVRETAEFSRALLDGTFTVGNELKKAVEVAFKKGPAEVK